MPANVVKTKRDERLWKKAKLIAKKANRSKDFAYIMGIYKKMTGRAKKVTEAVDAWVVKNKDKLK